MTARVESKVTAEMIEAARPILTWIAPTKVGPLARWFLRRGWIWGGDEWMPFSGGIRARKPDLILFALANPNGTTLESGTTAIRVYFDGNLVITGPRKDEVMGDIARLRASKEAEAEDGEGRGHQYDTRLINIPGYLRD